MNRIYQCFDLSAILFFGAKNIAHPFTCAVEPNSSARCISVYWEF
jgi:hypothetical protein